MNGDSIPTTTASHIGDPLYELRDWRKELKRTDEQLRASISTFERLADFGGWVVVAGGALAAAFSIAKLSEAAPDIAVAAGVAAEILFARKAARCAEELQRRSDMLIAELNVRAKEAIQKAEEAQAEVANANARAAEANLKVAQIVEKMQPRRIDAEAFKASIAGKPTAEAEIFFDEDVWDASLYANHLYIALRSSGWGSTIPEHIPQYDFPKEEYATLMPKHFPLGMQAWTISILTLDESLANAREALSKAIGASTHPIQVRSVGANKYVNPGRVRVLIGARQP
jgi:hypothetical protein